MTDPSHGAGPAPAAASTSSGRELSLPGWGRGLDRERVERDRLSPGRAPPTPHASCSAASRAGPPRSNV